MQRFRVECNFGSKYFDDIFNARRYFYKCIERDLQVELWKVTQELMEFYGYLPFWASDNS